MLASEGGAFGGLDLVFFLGYVVTVVTIGFVAGHRKKDTVGDYFRAGNRLPWFAIGFSIIASGISSEQFVGEMGYAYKLGLPVVNWDWLVFPAMSILLWIFIPIYLRGRITTMPEYLERRYGGKARTMYAILIIASYVFVNFALVFYTGGYAIEKMWGFNRVYAVWILAIVTGAYTIYGGLTSVAWTDFFQCALLLGGGIFLFFSGMERIDWDFAAVFGTGQYGHLIPPADHPDIPWTALIILALSTNVWYYATDQFINQRCLGARSEWHAKMGVLLAGGLQFFLPLATCFPGMIYRVINPDLADHNAAYPEVVAAVVPVGLRGIVVAAVLGAITSTIAGLVNSTATMTTLDIFRRWKGKDWPEKRLVRFGQYAGGTALLIGALLAPVVMAWEDLFMYCQDLWAPLAAPAVIVFLGGALWKGANERGAVACLWLSILTVPFSFLNKYLTVKQEIFILPEPMRNPMVFAGSIFLISIVLLVELSRERRPIIGTLRVVVLSVLILAIGSFSAQVIALLVAVTCLGSIVVFMRRNLHPTPGGWDRSMLHLPSGEQKPWYMTLWLWWGLVAAGYVAIYVVLW
jgi:solute:Na+ symporter, SSS family